MFTTETKTATITNAVSNGSTIVYTATNTFAIGDIVHISGISPVNFNIPDAVITARTSSNFTIASTETGTWTTSPNAVAVYDELKNHLISSSSVKVNTLVAAEWNLNAADNIDKVGNYRYRPDAAAGSKFKTIATSYDSTDSNNDYTNATYADVFIDVGFNDDDTPYVIASQNEKTRLLFSLEECFGKNRPRSGINKLMNFPGRYANISNENMALRPRYYPASKNDKFKYWCSFRTESLDATITAITPSSPAAGSVTYTANNSFAVDDYVYISGLAPSEYNGEFKITARTTTSFTVANTSTSARTNQNGTAIVKDRNRGISKTDGSNYYIDDAAPFVVYKTSVPANRVVVKMQTHVGTNEAYTGDPFYGSANKAVPKDWKIQKLNLSGNWETIADNLTADEIDEDGYVEIAYGVNIPTGAQWTNDTFYYVGDYAIASDLPVSNTTGYGYLVGANSTTAGTWYVYNGTSYSQVAATYGWRLESETVSRLTPFAKDLTNPEYYTSGSDRIYREVDFVKGLRIVVTKMNKANATFDLIELSPRLAVNLSDKTTSFSVTKHASDLGNSGMPVGQLLVGGGSLEIFDYDQAFNPNNTFDYDTNSGSIINDFSAKNLQVKMYEITRYVNGYDYYIPIKTMFCFGFPNYSSEDRAVSLELRDYFLVFESMNAPEVFIRDVSLSYAISILLDSIGFSNYIFKRIEGIPDPIIPFFYIPSGVSVAEILQALAVSTQHMMFFDEYNNFVVMSKEYSMPTEEDRSTDFVLYGSQDYTVLSDLNIKKPSAKLANILGVGSKIADIYNDGKLTYSVKSIARENNLMQKIEVDKGKTWTYKPTLLWEAMPHQNIKSSNYENSNGLTYTLTALPLNTDIPENPPVYTQQTSLSTTSNLILGDTVINVSSTSGLAIGQTITKVSGTGSFGSNTVEIVDLTNTTITVNLPHTVAGAVSFTANAGIFNYVIDFGDASNWLPRYNGYFYANGEIIKYDAVEFTVQGIGDVWITSVLDYQNYFSKLGFGKKIYPTGRVRIYYKLDENNVVVRHGRGQFGTDITSHSAGISSHWKDTNNMRGFTMQAEYVLDEKKLSKDTEVGKAGIGDTGSPYGTTGKNTTIARKNANISGVIKNVESTMVQKENALDGTITTRFQQSTINPSVQASALIVSGPSPKVFSTNKIKGKNFITYVKKQLDNKFTHFGTRLRIIGRPQNTEGYATATELENPEVYFEKQKINGGGAGLAFMLDTTTNNGYYFEIVALGFNNIEDVNSINNVFLYKVKKGSSSASSEPAIPELLWSGSTQVLPDRGEFSGQSRIYAEGLQTVFDLAVEYKDSGTSRKFFLYLNNSLIGTVVDKKPLPAKNNMALFVRGSSKAMFENIYAIRKNYGYDGSAVVAEPPAQSRTIFDDSSITVNEALKKYSMSGLIKSTVLTNISSSGSKYNIYYDEFGTIMRECAYFDIKYDKAYPALYSRIAPTFKDTKGYFISGYRSTAYGAEFLVFNCTDTFLSIGNDGQDTGEYLRIQGIALTDDVQMNLTVDDYYNKKADLSMLDYSGSSLITTNLYKDYVDIKNSRATYGTKAFDISAQYIQSHDDATNMLGWIISKISKPRKAVGLQTFGTPYAQLGDIVKIDYVDENDIGQVSLKDSRYVLYSMEYKYTETGPEHTLYLSEVQ